jgi:ribosomal protein L40E
MTQHSSMPVRAWIELPGVLGTTTICARCGATLFTYADRCKASLSERCEGFERIEREVSVLEGGPAS